jgi:hypothetical protein
MWLMRGTGGWSVVWIYVVNDRDWWHAVSSMVINLISIKGTVLLDKMSW